MEAEQTTLGVTCGDSACELNIAGVCGSWYRQHTNGCRSSAATIGATAVKAGSATTTIRGILEKVRRHITNERRLEGLACEIDAAIAEMDGGSNG